jgi:hypothetical protein
MLRFRKLIVVITVLLISILVLIYFTWTIPVNFTTQVKPIINKIALLAMVV